MQYADNRELRKEMFMAFNTRAFKGNEFDNSGIIKELANLRYEKATLLGYETWADYILEERMANSKQIVLDFLEDIREVAEPAAKKKSKNLMHTPN